MRERRGGRGLTTAGYVAVLPSPVEAVDKAPRPLPQTSRVPAVASSPLQLPHHHLGELVGVWVLGAPLLTALTTGRQLDPPPVAPPSLQGALEGSDVAGD